MPLADSATCTPVAIVFPSARVIVPVTVPLPGNTTSCVVVASTATVIVAVSAGTLVENCVADNGYEPTGTSVSVYPPLMSACVRRTNPFAPVIATVPNGDGAPPLTIIRPLTVPVGWRVTSNVSDSPAAIEPVRIPSSGDPCG